MQKKIKSSSERVTSVRQTILALFADHHEPLSAQDLLSALKKRNLPVNKTTVYRQLATLLEKEEIREVHLEDRTVRYEMNEADAHHHHLVCLKCKNIEDIDFPDDLIRQEKMIWKKKKFKVLHHSLEFFGRCSECVKIERLKD